MADLSVNPCLLTAENISVPHGFTTRQGGVSKDFLSSLNIGFHRGDAPENVAENYARLSQILSFSPEDLVLARQTHSDIVRVVDRSDAGKGLDHHAYPECDGLVTQTPGLALVVFTADCTPILLHDPVTGAVGVVHAGWRGTANGIAAKAIDAMAKNFGSDPKNIRAAIGPNIAQCCFETDPDVPNAIRGALGNQADPFIRKVENKFYVNLKEINALWLRNCGVENIHINPLCTACRTDLFWSHRRTSGIRGSQGGIIVCKQRG